MKKQTKIYIAGHRGMVGSAIERCLRAHGYDNLLLRTRAELDLLDQRAVTAFLAAERPDYVFIAAALVGGIHANNTRRADFIYQNLMVEANLIHGAHMAEVRRLMFLGSSCIYPKLAPQPIREDALLTGLLEETNEPYAIAKIAGIKMCDAYNAQFGRRYVSAMPTNLYGPNDSYDLMASHVLPALIRKAHLGRLAGVGDIEGMRSDERAHGPVPDDVLRHFGCSREAGGEIVASDAQAARPRLVVWGTGRPRREFLHVDDMAAACVFMMEGGIDEGLFNVGAGDDITIRDLAKLVLEVVGFSGELVFDATKPDGTPRKLMDSSLLNARGWRATIPLRAGIATAYRSYLDSAPP